MYYFREYDGTIQKYELSFDTDRLFNIVKEELSLPEPDYDITDIIKNLPFDSSLIDLLYTTEEKRFDQIKSCINFDLKSAISEDASYTLDEIYDFFNGDFSYLGKRK